MCRLRNLLILLIALMSLNTPAATRVNILWIGNSLTQSPWCIDEGWLATQVMANTITAKTGIELACFGVMKGATSLATHWSQQSGFSQLDTPVVRKPTDRWATENVDKYDYIMLQTFARSAGALTAESTALVKYCDLALSKGTKPVIFLCWDAPALYAAQTRAFDSVYARYKARGALLAPLFDIHTAINAEKPTTYLYGADAYLHVDINGAYLNLCVFNFLFTGVKPSAYDIALMPTCTDIPALIPEKNYLAGKAEATLAKYYDLGGSAIRFGSGLHSAALQRQPGSDIIVDFSGRYIERPSLKKQTAPYLKARRTWQ